MIRRVKDWLGIESVKIDLILPPTIEEGQKYIQGVVVLQSPSVQTIKSVRLSFIETYQRGSGKEKRINDFLLASWSMTASTEVPAKEPFFIPFQIKPDWMQSSFDQIAKGNRLIKPVLRLLKRMGNVSSEYRFEVEAKVKKAKLHPFYKAYIDIIS